MDNKGRKKRSGAMGQGEEEIERDGCIILRKGEVLGLKVIDDDLKKREEKEKLELQKLFRDKKGGQGNEES